MELAAESQRFNDPTEATGTTTGAIKNCKMGDFVTVRGPDSAAPGARIVWEAKDDKSYDLKRALAEKRLLIDVAMEEKVMDEAKLRQVLDPLPMTRGGVQ